MRPARALALGDDDCDVQSAFFSPVAVRRMKAPLFLPPSLLVAHRAQPACLSLPPLRWLLLSQVAIPYATSLARYERNVARERARTEKEIAHHGGGSGKGSSSKPERAIVSFEDDDKGGNATASFDDALAAEKARKQRAKASKKSSKSATKSKKTNTKTNKNIAANNKGVERAMLDAMRARSDTVATSSTTAAVGSAVDGGWGGWSEPGDTAATAARGDSGKGGGGGGDRRRVLYHRPERPMNCSATFAMARAIEDNQIETAFHYSPNKNKNTNKKGSSGVGGSGGCADVLQAFGTSWQGSRRSKNRRRLVPPQQVPPQQRPPSPSSRRAALRDGGGNPRPPHGRRSRALAHTQVAEDWELDFEGRELACEILLKSMYGSQHMPRHRLRRFPRSLPSTLFPSRRRARGRAKPM